jgi:hypothetical protein
LPRCSIGSFCRRSTGGNCAELPGFALTGFPGPSYSPILPTTALNPAST